jgi:UDP:flavonoid glycosyltransferase YjiC (YdhE family)
VRVLAATTANDGHFGPILPFARAFRDAGHEVRVAAPASYAEKVARAGFAHEPFADAPPELVGPVMAVVPTLPFDEANRVVVREVFARIDAQAALPGLTEAIDQWRPDLVVRESAELGSLAAAERAGVPHVHVAIGMHEVADQFFEEATEPIAELGRVAGLADGQLAAALAAETMLSCVPASVDGAGAGAVHRFRDPGLVDPAGGLPEPWGDPDAPLVYVTFGSVTARLGVFDGVFREALDGLADQPVRVLMTTGRGLAPASLAPVPANTHLEQWWPQGAALAHAAAMLGHGGFGTTMGALANGVPQVVAPIFTTDQVANARHVADSGTGIGVEPGPGGVTRATASVGALLDDPSYAVRARAVAAEIAALPHPAEAVPLLTSLLG